MTLAYAVVRGDPPIVYAAEDVDTLHRVLMLEVVTATPSGSLNPGRREELRAAVLEERWGDAILGWMEATDSVVDVYSSGLEVWSAARLSGEIAGLELQLRPLFDDTGA